MSPWLHRTVLVSLLMTAYLYAWTPVRTAWITHGAAPLLHAAAGDDVRVRARPAAQALSLHHTSERTTRHTAPAGVKFLLPALFLVLLAPRRPRLAPFFAGHLVLGGLALGLLAAGTGGLPGGLAAADFVQGYGVDAYSLIVPVLVWAHPRSGGSP